MPTKRSYKSTPHTRKGATTSFGSRTDIGCVREHNEDSLVVAPPLYAVADGMGGHAAGEVASEIAVNVLAQEAPRHADGEALARAVETANITVISAAADGMGRAGMGTTMTAAMIEGERLVIAQVGDSRAYLMHDGHLQQITRDHSLVADLVASGQITEEEARIHPQRSVITRALGSDPHMHADIYELNVEAGDRLLLCSDGLSGMLLDSEIEATMRRIRDPQRCASHLVNDAITAGGYDNVTVVVADVEGHAERAVKKMTMKSRAFAAFLISLLLIILGGTAFGVHMALDKVAYLADSHGKVALYTGVPGSFLGFDLSDEVEVTDIATDDLQPGTAKRLKEEGIRTDTLDEAYALLDEYKAEAKKSSDDSKVSSASKKNAVKHSSVADEQQEADAQAATVGALDSYETQDVSMGDQTSTYYDPAVSQDSGV